MLRREGKKERKPAVDIVYDDSDDDDDDDGHLEAFRANFSQHNDGFEDELPSDDSEDDEDDDDDDEEEESDLEAAKGLSLERKEAVEAKVQKLKAALDSVGVNVAAESSDEGEEDDDDDDDDGFSAEKEEEPVPQPANAVKRRVKEEVGSVSPPKRKRKEEEEEGDVDEQTRKSIRDELRQMSLEEIQRLKERLGLKAFDRAMGAEAERRRKGEEFKRENKNRPREMSSKRAVPRLRDVVGVRAEQNARDSDRAKRDPRFDATCGEFDKKVRTSSHYPGGSLSVLTAYYCISRSFGRTTSSWTPSSRRRGSG